MPKPVEVHGATPVPHEPPDRLAWRVRLKANPVTRMWFKIGVGVLGTLLIIASALTGWLPGPGGIPLFLTGMALLATEFIWAKKLRKRIVRAVRVYLEWPVHKQRLFWAGFFATLGLIQYTYMAIFGIPGWVPHWAARWLDLLPLVD